MAQRTTSSQMGNAKAFALRFDDPDAMVSLARAACLVADSMDFRRYGRKVVADLRARALSGLFTILHVKIKNHDPVILLVDQPPANQRLIEADGEPSDGVVYDWEGSDPAKVTLTPKGPHLCPDASFCQTLARAISIGETRATVTLICQFTRATSSATVRVVAAKIRLKEVSFSGTTYRAVAEDGKTTTYDAPHWQDNSSPPDGDANDPGDHRFPVSYTRGGKIRVSAVFTIESDVKNAWENSSLDGFLVHCPDNSFAVVLNDSNFIQTFFSPYGGQ